ncbi:hypothetical protein P7K49_013856 [Saguinus oedipus]|uniref:Uncharacterized protein n=1 Tax=Saguinus oedipus TaxID=9490 RepID=A0ABQ9VHA1_SAGOE|nr:hypothetical protein P7K49_013856 [Saguinus oedipus]
MKAGRAGGACPVTPKREKRTPARLPGPPRPRAAAKLGSEHARAAGSGLPDNAAAVTASPRTGTAATTAPGAAAFRTASEKAEGAAETPPPRGGGRILASCSGRHPQPLGSACPCRRGFRWRDLGGTLPASASGPPVPAGRPGPYLPLGTSAASRRKRKGSLSPSIS